MTVCPRCQQHNPEGATACAHCGAPLEQPVYRACPTCKALNPALAVYCHRCFSPLDAAVQASLDSAPPAQGVRPPARPRPTTAYRLTLGSERSPAPSAGQAVGHNAPAEPSADGAASASADQGPEDPLAGLQNALPLEAAVLGAPLGTLPAVEPPGEAERRAAELFRQIASERAPLSEGKIVVVPRHSRLLGRLGRILLNLLVLVAALAPRFSGGVTRALIQPHAAPEALVAAAWALPAAQPVLISFDYGAVSQGELGPLVADLLDTLAEREVPLVVMSTTPAGLGLAQEALDTLSRGRDVGLAYGEDCLLLGYLPGEAVGLRTLSVGLAEAFRADYVAQRPLGEFPILSGGTDLAAIRDVFVLSDDGASARRWVEQVGTRSEARLHALVPARVEPLLQPYRRSGQLATLASGAAGATGAETAAPGEVAGCYAGDGLAAVVLLAGLVALAANIVPLLGRGRGNDHA